MDAAEPRPRRGARPRPRLHAGLPLLQFRPARLDQRPRLRRGAGGARRRVAGGDRGFRRHRSQHGRPRRAQRLPPRAKRRGMRGDRSSTSSSFSARPTTARRSSGSAIGSTSCSARRPTPPPSARLGKIRSAGVTDLRYGDLLDEDWQGRDRFAREPDSRRVVPLPKGVACYAIAATTAPTPGGLKDRLLGDGLVPVASALGRHKDPARALKFPARPAMDRLRNRAPRPAEPARRL